MVAFDPLLLGSVSFLLVMAVLIILRIIKLNIDENNARQRAEAIRAMATSDDRRERRERGPHIVWYIGSEEEELLSNVIGEPEERIGKKKMAKLQAKAERKAQREAELAEREERKRREQEREEQREKEREKERLEEEAELERKRIERENQERREEELYQKMKEEFQVDEEGFDQLEEENENLMQEFIDYISKAKVVNIDELASHFKLRTEDVVDRLNYFLDNGKLDGFMDDRGRFIMVTKEDFQKGIFSLFLFCFSY
uniref:DDRGK domain-containing protein 1 n=1 Tax=Syphacia muris TaxID=451379 RepID=A0A0N5AWR4_9BILA